MLKSLGYALFVSLGSLCLIGCPDSTPQTPQGSPGPGTPPDTSAAPLDGGVAETDPGPPPEVKLDEDGAPIIDGSMVPAAGEGVVVSGKASYTGDAKGAIRVDIIQARAAGGTELHPFNTVLADADGKWSFEVPKDVGAVTVVAYIDLNKDGPNPGEPSGVNENVTVGTDGASGIEIQLSEDNAGMHDPDHPGGEPGAAPPSAPREPKE